MAEQFDLVCKVVLVGESGVGKTSIINRYVENYFNPNSESTTGASFASKIVTFDKFQKSIKFEIWDTAGQEKYRALTKIFFKNAAIAILVYDITIPDSFYELKNFWYDQVKTYGFSNTIIGVAANKCDLFIKETISENEGKKFAKSIGAVFKETSAEKDCGITDLFKVLGEKFLCPTYDEDEKSENHKLSENIEEKPKGCC